MPDQPLKAAIAQQINALPCGHFARDAVVRMTRAHQRALREERKAAGQEVPRGALWRLGDVRITIDDAASEPTVACRHGECGEDVGR